MRRRNSSHRQKKSRSLNIDMKQLNRLTSREINFRSLLLLFFVRNQFYGAIRFGHETISMTAGAQVVTAHAADQFQGKPCCHPQNFLLRQTLINSLVDVKQSIKIEFGDENNDELTLNQSTS